MLEFSRYDIQRNISLPKVNKKLAEFFGILSGDGYLLNRRNRYTIEITLNLTEDSLYIEYVSFLIKKLFNLDPKILKRKIENRADIIINSKAIYNFLHGLGFPIGTKKNKLIIPNWIIKNKIFIKFFLRGVFDTDGSLFFAKRGTYKMNEYPVIEIKISDQKFIEQLSKALNLIKFNHLRRINKIQLNGKKLLEKWITEIGIKNFNSLSRYFVWKKFKYCPPNTSLKKRLEMLGWQN